MCISCYFRSTKVQPLLLHPQMSNMPLSENPVPSDCEDFQRILTLCEWWTCCIATQYICMQKHIQYNKTSGHSSLEKYTSHLIWKGSKGLLKVLLCERWVGDWTELQHIDPHSYGHNSVSFPFSWAAQPGARRPSFSGTWSSFQRLLSNSLNFLSLGSYNNLTSTLLPASVTISHSIQPLDSQDRPWSPDIFDRMHLLFTQVHLFFWQLGRVGGQYATNSFVQVLN